MTCMSLSATRHPFALIGRSSDRTRDPELVAHPHRRQGKDTCPLLEPRRSRMRRSNYSQLGFTRILAFDGCQSIEPLLTRSSPSFSSSLLISHTTSD